MTRLGSLGVAALALALLATDAMAQRRGGGAVRGGMRGAAVGGMVGGSEGAAKGAKVGVVTGATRAAINRETQRRANYQATTEYENAQHLNFNEAPLEVFGTTADDAEKKFSGKAVLRKDGKPIVGITFPSDWKQKKGKVSVSAVSADGQAYAKLVLLNGVADKQAGIDKVKQGLKNSLNEVEYDEPTTKRGAVVITGKGKAKKAGGDVVFAVAVFNTAKGQVAGVAFVADAKMEDYYKETVRGICQSILRAKDFAK